MLQKHTALLLHPPANQNRQSIPAQDVSPPKPDLQHASAWVFVRPHAADRDVPRGRVACGLFVLGAGLFFVVKREGKRGGAGLWGGLGGLGELGAFLTPLHSTLLSTPLSAG